MTEWTIRGSLFNNCNCAFGCPCQFHALPTTGFCEALIAVRIDEGRHGDVSLDGLKFIGAYRWPGAIHEGNGTMQAIIDARADERQRAALLAIVNGEDTDEMATIWWVTAMMSPNKLPPLHEEIDFELDVEGRTGRVAVADLVEMRAEPVRNPVTGQPHRARIDIPDGFEYEIAEVGSGSSRSSTGVALDLADTHAHFARLHIGTHGVVHGA